MPGISGPPRQVVSLMAAVFNQDRFHCTTNTVMRLSDVTMLIKVMLCWGHRPTASVYWVGGGTLQIEADCAVVKWSWTAAITCKPWIWQKQITGKLLKLVYCIYLYNEASRKKTPLPWQTIFLKGPHISGRRSHISIQIKPVTKDHLSWEPIFYG